MVEASDLYQEVILDHTKSPRNFERMEDPDRKADGDNPLCGDELTVYLDIEDGKVEEVTFEGEGCAISKASGSVMTEAVEGQDLEEVQRLVDVFQKLVTGDEEVNEMDAAELGDLAVFTGVQRFPTRVKCATLSWHTLKAALEGREEPVSTE
jgi:nitrogen fixation NifU-like protein